MEGKIVTISAEDIPELMGRLNDACDYLRYVDGTTLAIKLADKLEKPICTKEEKTGNMAKRYYSLHGDVDNGFTLNVYKFYKSGVYSDKDSISPLWAKPKVVTFEEGIQIIREMTRGEE